MHFPGHRMGPHTPSMRQAYACLRAFAPLVLPAWNVLPPLACVGNSLILFIQASVQSHFIRKFFPTLHSVPYSPWIPSESWLPPDIKYVRVVASSHKTKSQPHLHKFKQLRCEEFACESGDRDSSLVSTLQSPVNWGNNSSYSANVYPASTKCQVLF